RRAADCRSLRGTSICADHSLFCNQSSGRILHHSSRDGKSGRLLDPDSRNDHRPPNPREGARLRHIFTRRKFITGAVTTSLAASAAGATALFAKYGLIPPDHGGLFGVGETLTYAAHRVLLNRGPMAREFRRNQISQNFPAINTTLPEDNS